MKWYARACLALLATSAVYSGSVQAVAVTGTLFFTTFSGGTNVNKVSYSYDGVSTFALGSVVNIDSTFGADGIIFAPDGDLIVGGQGDRVHKVKTDGSGHSTVGAGGTASFHVMLDPSGTKVWSAGIPGALAEIPLTPFAGGTAHALSGDDTAITTIAFDAGGTAYYTASGSGGFGSFGTIDLTTFTTTSLMTGVAAAHGMAFDPFTGDLILFGDNHVTQIDTTTLTIVSDLDLSTLGLGLALDQGTVDGKGNLFAASNTGVLFFMDYSATGLVAGAGNFFAAPFLAASLDDVAPLSGAGSNPVPAPATLALMGLGLLSLAGLRRRPRNEGHQTAH